MCRRRQQEREAWLWCPPGDRRRVQEKEAQRAAREAQRDELKAAQETEKAQEDAEQQETTCESLLARAEAEVTTGVLLRELMEKVATFEAKLDEGRKKKERAIDGSDNGHE